MKLFLDSCIVIYVVELIDPWRTRVEELLLTVVPESLDGPRPRRAAG